MSRMRSRAAEWCHRHGGVWLMGAVLCAVLAIVLLALNLASTLVEAKSELSAGPVAVPPAVIPFDLERFALNMLLVPLIDDAQPPRWTDTALRHFCGPATRVRIDNQPMQPNTPVPATSFSVRWQMDRCMPMGFETLELSGEVELLVFHEEDGLGAVVLPQRLLVSTLAGRSWLKRPFAARMSYAEPIAAPAAAPPPHQARRGE